MKLCIYFYKSPFNKPKPIFMKSPILFFASLFMLTINFNTYSQSSWTYGTGVINTNNPIATSIGVGIASPARQLHVQTSQTNGGLRVTQTTTGFSALELFNSSTGGRNYALVSTGNGNTTEGVGNFGIYDYTSSAYRFFINSTGNIGVGTYTIGSKLQVNGNTAIGYSSSTTAPSNGLCVNGNVGIGTTSPSQKLEVNGNISLTGNGTNGNAAIIGAKTQGYIILNANSDANNGSSLVLYGSSSAYYPGCVRFISYQSNGKIVFSNYNGSTWPDQMTVLANGNVLIGKNSQVNALYMLDVNGTIRANEIVVNTTGADFVFSDDYKLLSLKELEESIKENRHLPGIPSADNMQRNGMTLGQTNTLLLQKIEELTLYLIEQNKTIEKMQIENATLKQRISNLEKN